MIKDITIGQYLPGDSSIHNLDPRVKISATFIFMINLFIINNFLGYVPNLIFLISVIIISRIPVKYIFKGLKPILAILIITGLLNMFLTTGTELYRLGPLVITYEGLRLAAFMILRLIFLIIGTSVLTLTTSPISLTDGIEHLLNPLKRIGVPAHELAMMMTIALRFIPTLLDETDKIMKAQMARGADFESGNIVNRAKNMVPLLVPLFISSFRRADDLAMAMEARCYRGGVNRTRLKQLKIKNIDKAAMAIIVLLVAVSVYSRFL
ncbi:energy-coupling factor transporter transmembrane protein EcfT [Oxobacter pfennigii]|uniref:Energy-coupling factor transporter transmembrane protein EcfT n=1 Tax=Oxobacter pfennigii TaxID=36849 RepID=A0A0P9ABX9_9CLOT|nr:energy-coupling factor transporter transmembrane component T [Oxobacter pfennigii]KPU42602.1 energy-coupling factor transporter transmembrane protein EcfT [Oxobacter pfennigii]